MSQNLKQKAVKGLFWTGLESFSQQGVSFIIGIILARLLSPEEFGVIGIVTVFVIILRVFVDSGFSSALIQSKENTHLQESSVFYFNIGLSFIAAAALFFSAPLISNFYGRPELNDISKVLSLLVILGAFRAVHQSLLTRAVNFKPQFYVTFGSRILSGGIGIYFAYTGHGVWALVYQKLMQDFLSTVGYWLIYKWHPLFLFSFKSISGLWQFGSKILLANIIKTTSDNIYTLVIGKIFSAYDLGLYSRGNSLMGFPLTLIIRSIGKVSYPIYASIKEDRNRLLRVIERSLNATMFISLPIFVSFYIVSEPLVRILLTDKWIEVVPLLKLFCIIGAIRPWHSLNIQIINAYGRSDLNLKITLYRNILRILNLFVMYRWGLEAIVFGQVVISILNIFINTSMTKKILNIGLFAQVKIIHKTAISVLIGIVGVKFVYYFSKFNNDIYTVLVSVGVFAIIYFLITIILKNPILMEIVNLRKNN